MKLLKAKIINFRLLHNLTVTFDQNTTSIVGKNNTGKTSLSSIFRIFLSENNTKFPFEDFSLKSHNRFISAYKYYQSINEDNKEIRLKRLQKIIPKIQLFLTIQYDENDNWANIKPFFIDLSEYDKLTILCEFAPESTENFLNDLNTLMKDIEYSADELINSVSNIYQNHYKVSIRPYSELEETENVERSNLKNLIQAKFIKAQRVLDDSDSESKSRLSRVFQNQFDYESKQNVQKSNDLRKIISDASINIDEELSVFFSSFIDSFEKFGFPGLSNEKVELLSNLDPEVLFKNNIKLFYNHEGKKLPEKYNGLGYSNLIYIISQIIGFYSETKDHQNNLKLIFIEEPEAHMHPQMQSVFIRNIENFLNSVGLVAQVIITTHSSHILSNSHLESIRYFTKDTNKNIAVVKDLMKFNTNLSESETKKFLQQYLTLGRCDLFFADKAILFEGTVERILLPVFIEKVENEQSDCNFSEQYISSIEIGGAYMIKFKELLEFLNLKTLIITDIDSVRNDTKKKTEVRENENLITSNMTLKNWIPKKENIDELLEPTINKENENATIRVAYQNNVNPLGHSIKCGRSFEEAFIIDNYQYIFSNRENLLSIKSILTNYQNADDIITNSFAIQDFIDRRNKKKTDFAFDLLLIDGWTVPTYIKEGLIWLAK